MKSGDLKIQRLLLEIVNRDEKNYKSDESLLASIINESLNAVIEEYYSEGSTTNIKAQIEKWDIDLGKITWPLNKDQILDRLKEKIYPLINRNFSEAGKNSEGKSVLRNEKKKSESGSESDILLFFLKNGHLPGYANSLPSGNKLADPEMISVISKFILQDNNGTAIQRLIRQYNFSELRLFTSGLVHADHKTVLLELNQMIESLVNSESQSQKMVANDLMRHVLIDLVKNGGKMKPLAVFISEYFKKNPTYKGLIDANQFDYDSSNSIESIKKLIDELNKEQILHRLRENTDPLIKDGYSATVNNTEFKPELINEDKKSERGSQSDLLLFFLKNGHLPWYANSLPSGNKLADPEMIAVISKFILHDKSETAIQRLLRQYNFSELSLFTAGLVNAHHKTVLLELNQVIASLVKSESQSQKKVANDLMRNVIVDLVKSSGKIKPFTAFIAEYFEKNTAYKGIIDENLINYDGNKTIESIKKWIDEAYLIFERNKQENQAINSLKNVNDNHQRIMHYLSFGSLPYGWQSFTKDDLDLMMTEFIIKNELTVQGIVEHNPDAHDNIFKLLINLPLNHFKSLLIFVITKLDDNDQTLKVLLSELLESPALANERKVVSTGIIINKVFNQPFSPHLLQGQSTELLTASENERLEILLSNTSFLSELKKEPFSKDVASKAKINSAYFSDILQYVLQNRNWPWWADKFVEVYGQLNLQTSFEKGVNSIITNFESSYPSDFVAFSKTLLLSNSKPSVLFSKLDWESSRIILNAALPANKNKFIDTVEVILGIIVSEKAFGINTNSAVQQFILSIIDKKYAKDAEFQTLINDIIINAAVKFDLPLWSVYGLISNNAAKLKLENSFPKTEMDAMFSYTNEREEIYGEIKLRNKTASHSLYGNSSDFTLISDSHESHIIDYLSGNNSVISVFPSPSALGQFIVERIKNSVSFKEKLKQFLLGKDSKLIHRLIELEYLCRQTFIDKLLPATEHTQLQELVFELIKDTLLVNENVLRNLIRMAFIDGNYWKNQDYPALNLRKTIEKVSDYLGINAQLIEHGIIKKLSLNNALAERISVKLKLPQDLADKISPAGESFVNHLRIVQKKHVIDLFKTLHAINDKKVTANFTSSLFALKDKEGLLAWIRRSAEFESKAELLRIINEISDGNQIGKTLDLIKTEYTKLTHDANKTVLFLTETGRNSLISYLGTDFEFSEKKALLQMIESDNLVRRKDVENIINEVANVDIKRNLLELMDVTSVIRTFLEQSKVNSLNPISKLSNHLADKWQSLINFIQQQSPFHKKNEFIEFIRSGNFASKDDLEHAFSGLTNQLVKNRVFTFVNSTFTESDFTASATEMKDKEWNTHMLWWKEKLNFETSINVEVSESLRESGSIVESRSIKKVSHENKDKVIDAQNLLIFSFLDNSDNKIRLEKESPATDAGNSKANLTLDTSNLSKGNKNTFDNSEFEYLNKVTASGKQETRNKDNEQKNENKQRAVVNDPVIVLPKDVKYDINDQSTLSPAGIADIAVYFLINLELPWWSSVKDLSVFERKLQGLSLSEPLILRQKLLEAAKWNKDYIENIFEWMLNEDEMSEIKFLAKEELEETLRADLELLSGFANENKSYSQFEILTREVVSKFRSDSSIASETIFAFRKTVLITLQAAVPDFFDLLKEFYNQTKLPIARDYLELSEMFVKESLIKDKQEYGAKNFLKGLERKYNKLGIEKGISITENLFSLYKRKDKQPIQDLINSWLKMLETITGINLEDIKKDVVTSQSEKKQEEMIFIEKELLKIAAVEIISTEVHLLNFSNYLNALSLILDQVQKIEPGQRLISLNLFSKLVMSNELDFNTSLTLSLFFNYLYSIGTEKSELDNIIIKLSTNSENPDIKQIFGLMHNALNGIYVRETYGTKTTKPKEKQKGEAHQIVSQIDSIIRLFKERRPLLEKVRNSKQALKVDTIKKQEPKAISPKKTVALDLEGRIYIPNAGLVILWPFLSRLFNNLKYTANGQFIDKEKRLRAIYLSQYLVGFSENNPEYTLMLNKLICGMNLEEPIEEEIILTTEEKAEARNLFTSIMLQWKEMNNTSMENFQRTFLQREGVMFKKDENWTVIVGKSTFDLILLKLPWGLSMIKYPWNNYLILVEWKAMN